MRIHFVKTTKVDDELGRVSTLCGLNLTNWRGRVTPDWELTKEEFMNRERFFRCKKCEKKLSGAT